jgi:cobalt transporter subunit CbtB
MITNDTSLQLVAPATSSSRLMQLGLAAFLGLFIVGFAGFSHIVAVHNAAHDVRHSLAFPCH